jgi:hypothetical protein
MLEEGERCQTMSLQPIITLEVLVDDEAVDCVGPNMIFFMVQNY